MSIFEESPRKKLENLKSLTKKAFLLAFDVLISRESGVANVIKDSIVGLGTDNKMLIVVTVLFSNMNKSVG